MANNILGQGYPDVLISTANLVLIDSNPGQQNKAEGLNIFKRKSRQNKPGEHHPDTLMVTVHLATTLRNQGLWRELSKY